MFSTIFIKRPRFAFVISLVIMLAGIASYFTLPVAEYPQVTPPVIVVGTFYPGASAQVIADTVAAPLETAINGVEGLTYFESKSDNSGNYTLTITFDTGVNEDMALTNVNNAVKMAESNLPSEVKTNLFSYKRSSDILGVIALQSSNPEHDLTVGIYRANLGDRLAPARDDHSVLRTRLDEPDEVGKVRLRLQNVGLYHGVPLPGLVDHIIARD